METIEFDYGSVPPEIKETDGRYSLRFDNAHAHLKITGLTKTDLTEIRRTIGTALRKERR